MKTVLLPAHRLPYLLLLPLVAVLLFGNCGGGVREVVNSMASERKNRFRAIVAQRPALRAAARQQLHGAARKAEYRRIDALKAARIDSLFQPAYLYYEREKYEHRRHKMTRQMLSPNNRALIPAIRIPIDTR